MDEEEHQQQQVPLLWNNAADSHTTTPRPRTTTFAIVAAILGCVGVLVFAVLVLTVPDAALSTPSRTARTTTASDTTPFPTHATPQRTRISLDSSWRFQLASNRQANCSQDSFPKDLNDQQCLGLVSQAYVVDLEGCREACCAHDDCLVWQWCPQGAACSPQQSCWTGAPTNCVSGPGWQSQGRNAAPSPTPVPTTCNVPECSTTFDDSGWESVNVPHDFVVLGNFTDKADMAHGYLPYGVGWYRFHMDIPSNVEDCTLWLEFEGVQRDMVVYINNKLAGTHKSGYTPWIYRVPVSALLRTGGDGAAKSVLIAVRVDASEPDGWWYDGGGIYRHVWATYVSNCAHIEPNGVYVPSNVDTKSISARNFVVAEPSARMRKGSLHPKTALFGNAVVEPEVLVSSSQSSPVDVVVACSVEEVSTGNIVANASRRASISGPTNVLMGSIDLPNAHLWSLEDPFLYRLVVSVIVANSSSRGSPCGDTVATTFGIRSIRWDVEKGFFLNEQSVKIKGMANHQDFCGVGVAVPDALQVFRVQRMKEMGANAWRTAHNPPNMMLLEECDRQGMLVWDENHRNRADTQDWIDDAKALILRDRNHPSVIMWSVCNEALCEGFNATSASILRPIFKQLDPKGNRPFTAAMNYDYDSDFRKVLDVLGVNYHDTEYDDIHHANATQPMIGSETSSDVSDRGIYANDKVRAYVSAYDVNYPQWGDSAEGAWCPIASRDFMSGAFIWTGFDYKGEPTPYGWPNINSHFGVIDICGFPKDNYYYYQSVWLPDPMVHVFPHWNWNDSNCVGACHKMENGAKTVEVWAYSNADSVELFVNNKSQGVKTVPVPKCRHVSWNVTYEPGTLTARGYVNGATVAEETVQTAGEPAAIAIDVEFTKLGNNTLVANGVDVALIRVQIVDENGILVPTASNTLGIAARGPIRLLGVGNGDPSSHEHDYPILEMEAIRSVWNGLARIIVQSTNEAGSAAVSIETDGLGSQEIFIRSVEE